MTEAFRLTVCGKHSALWQLLAARECIERKRQREREREKMTERSKAGKGCVLELLAGIQLW